MRAAADGYVVFETAIGPCAVVWRGERLVASSLPEASRTALVERIRRKFPAVPECVPPDAVARAVALVTAHLGGELQDLSQIEIDLDDWPDARRRILEASRSIPAGRTLTYGELSDTLGMRHGARAVGQAMAANPLPPVVPCHRLLGADRKLHGFSAYGGIATKRRLLTLEHADLEGVEEAPQLALFGNAWKSA